MVQYRTGYFVWFELIVKFFSARFIEPLPCSCLVQIRTGCGMGCSDQLARHQYIEWILHIRRNVFDLSEPWDRWASIGGGYPQVGL